ncbi:MAG: ABC transporter permease [Flavisolibacter sp.]|jgi:ABC-2 type transport system permease protein|nr:ABC transporter permease [Flavisolibacter sp.]
MKKEYNQTRALFAITKASLKATFRSPQSIFFSLFFPIVLIWIFGSLGSSGIPKVKVAYEQGTDTSNILYGFLKQNPVLQAPEKGKDVEDELRKGRIAAVIDIKENRDSGAIRPFSIHLRTSSAAQKDYGVLVAALNASLAKTDSIFYPQKPSAATVSQSIVEGRRYRMIDFFLPAMIGFSLIGAAVFGVAFSFYSLRETLVLKRMYSTPVKKHNIILGESLAKVIFQLLTVVVLIGFGYFVFDFYLANGWITFLNMMFLSFIALLVFMGFGFLITGVARNQNVIPIYANLFMFPQYFLSGTFFPKSSLPAFMQPFIQFLPLTAVNDSMRNVAFEGASLWSCWPEVLILLGWGLLIYFLTAKFFRWE